MKKRYLGYLVLPVALLTLLCFLLYPKPQTRPHIFLITLDGVSAQNLFIRNYHRDTMPFLKKLSQQGVVFSNAITLASQSLPGHASIFTSVTPQTLGIYKNGQEIDEQFTTLARMLKNNGYAPLAYINTALFEIAKAGILRDHKSYRKISMYDEVEQQSPTIFDKFFKSLRNNVNRINSGELKQPLYYWLHCQWAHSPYFNLSKHRQLFVTEGEEAYQGSDEQTVHAKIHLGEMPSEAEMEAMKARYDRSLRHMDEYLEQFFSLLEELGIRDKSLVIITADHGESFSPASGGGHSGIIDENVLRIPLIFLFPDKRYAGARVDELVDQRDVLPTIAHALGIRVPAQAQGRSLIPMMEGARVWKPHQVISIASPFTEHTIRDKRWKLIVPPEDNIKSYDTERYHIPLKYLLFPYTEKPLLFDLRSDPAASEDVSDKYPEIVKSLSAKLEQHSGGKGFKKTRLSRDVLQVLAKEGYLDPEEAHE